VTAEVELLREAATLTEPPDQAYVLVGDIPVQTLYQRDDTEARDGDWDDQRWFDVADGEADPKLWESLARLKPQRMYLRDDLPLSVAEALDAAERSVAS
jgi:hypothetical protein